MCVDCDSSVPVQRNKGPCQRSGDSWDMNEPCIGVVTEVEEGEVEKVNDEENFGPPEMSFNEEDHETKVEKVVENEVTSNTGGGLHILILLTEESPDVAKLDEEENEPKDVSMIVLKHDR